MMVVKNSHNLKSTADQCSRVINISKLAIIRIKRKEEKYSRFLKCFIKQVLCNQKG